mgnify:CR=1 FL=1
MVPKKKSPSRKHNLNCTSNREHQQDHSELRPGRKSDTFLSIVNNPDYLDTNNRAGTDELPDGYPSVEHKIEKAIEVTKTGLEQYENPAIMWTGGKDSTLTLYFVKEVAERFDVEVPPAIFIDHFQHFPELIDFAEHWADEWDVELVYARNDDVGNYVDEHDIEPGDDIDISELSEHNQHHVRNILEYEEDTFPFLLDTYVGNHLLKTVALNDALEQYDIDGILSGIRWDEQEARADETFFSPRHDPDIYPPHDRGTPLRYRLPTSWPEDSKFDDVTD